MGDTRPRLRMDETDGVLLDRKYRQRKRDSLRLFRRHLRESIHQRSTALERAPLRRPEAQATPRPPTSVRLSSRAADRFQISRQSLFLTASARIAGDLVCCDLPNVAQRRLSVPEFQRPITLVGAGNKAANIENRSKTSGARAVWCTLLAQ